MKRITRVALLVAAAAAFAVPTTANAHPICVYIGTFPECIDVTH